jgi:hypothetical protein
MASFGFTSWLDGDTSARNVKAIRLKLDVSHPYATLIKRRAAIPHPRHWVPLARLAGHNNTGGVSDESFAAKT